MRYRIFTLVAVLGILDRLRSTLAGLTRDVTHQEQAEDIARYHCRRETRVRPDQIEGGWLIGHPESGLYGAPAPRRG